MSPALSFVIPLYNSEKTIASLVAEISRLSVKGGLEIILVNDGSSDATASVCQTLLEQAAVPLTYVEHARNFGEHNAVLTGWRHARGVFAVNLDDDGQNPPAEALRLWHEANSRKLDVIFGHYESKQHSGWRNAGSWFTNRVTDWAVDKPKGFYLSSFRCVSRFVYREVSAHAGPYPYLDGLILQVTQKIGSISVRHDERRAGRSGYTFSRLLRLWLSAWVNFSILPLRLATVLGFATAFAGLIAVTVVIYLYFTQRGPAFGFGWIMSALLIFSGAQLLMLGLIGEYVGRMFLTVSQRPQSIVREVQTAGPGNTAGD